MKVIIAPAAFKGSLTAWQAAEHIKAGVSKAAPAAVICLVPAADGGEGTVEALVTATGGTINHCEVHGPFMEKIPSFYGVMGDGQTAVIEMAAAAGLTLVPADRRNPWHTTTFGVGELISLALDKGYRRFIIGIGGSSTNDGGLGLAQALGVRFCDNRQQILPAGQGGKQLGELADLDLTHLDPRVSESTFLVACDVTNPLTGPTGAAYIYGPQKGADAAMVEKLDQGLKNYAAVINKKLGRDLANLPGAGAAGGLGAGLVAFFGAKIESGIQIIIESFHLPLLLKGADLVITGEGQTDAQTVYGKVPAGIAKLAREYNIPVVCLSGALGQGYEQVYQTGVAAAFSSLQQPLSLEEAMAGAGASLIQNAYAVTRLYQAIAAHLKPAAAQAETSDE